MITVETQLSSENLPVLSEPVTSYLLIKLIPQTQGLDPNLPLNVSLVIDNSGSMYGADCRITHAISAACGIVDLLTPNDRISVVAFSDQAMVFQPSIPARDKEAIKANIRRIPSWDSGGTSMAKGMALSLEELGETPTAEPVNQVILLTDGITEGPETCLQIARQASQRGITFSCFGVGDEWNQPLLEGIASAGNGRWYYIESAGSVSDAFESELKGLQQSAVTNAQVTLLLRRGLSVKWVRQVEPEIADVVTTEVAEQEVVIKLGTLQNGVTVALLGTLSIAPREAGRYHIADVLASYTPPGSTTVSRTEPSSIEINVTSDSSQHWQNGDVLRYVDLEAVDSALKLGIALAEQGDKDRATRLLAQAGEISKRTGNQKKTRLIIDVQRELGVEGRISNRTILSATNEARKTRLMTPEDDNA